MTPYRLAPPGGASRAQPPNRARAWCNQEVAERLQEAADLLAATDGDPFRVAAYRKASETVAYLDRNLREIAQGGAEALEALPGVGHAIGRAIMQLVETGRWPYLEQLRGSADPVRLFQMIPGIGPELAQRIHDTLHVSTSSNWTPPLTEGAWIKCPVLGHAGRRCCEPHWRGCSRVGRRGAAPAREPSVDRLLDIDREYRNGLTIFEDCAASLQPHWRGVVVLHTQRGQWSFTALILIRQEPMNSGKRRNGW